MCTIGAVRGQGKTFLIKNHEYDGSIPIGWAFFEGGFAHEHFALVDHTRPGLNSGINAAGLGLVISQSDPYFGKKLELRTVLNAHILAECDSVEAAVVMIRKFVRVHPEMMGGNVILADENRIAVVEYYEGKSRLKIHPQGYLARANHSLFGLFDVPYADSPEESMNSYFRHYAMRRFLEDLYRKLPSLDRRKIMMLCKKVLRQGPIWRLNNLSSCVMDIHSRKVHYLVDKNGVWKSFQF